MSVRGNSIWIIVLALLTAGMTRPARAFDWPGWATNPSCQGCGRTISGTFFPRNVVYRSGVVYHGSCVPPPPPYQATASAAGYPGTPAPVGPSAPGEPAPERPSTSPGLSPPPMASGAGTGTGAPGETLPSSAESAANAAANAAAGDATALSSGLGGALGMAQGSLNMFGDLAPFRIAAQQAGGFKPPSPPEPPGNKPQGLSQSAVFNPIVRTFKIADNQTPMPVDRFSFSYNYFDYVNQSVNQRFNIPINRIQAMRYVFGFEKTFFDGNASVGVRLPLNNLVGNSNVAGLGQSSTALGDMSVYFKYALLIDREEGRVLSAGMAVTTPTGPTNFAGARWVRGLHFADLQPFVALQYKWDRAYLIGFSSISVPTSHRDAVVIYNDLGLGYFLYRDEDPNSNRLVKAVSPIFEVHVNTPTNHRDVFNPRDYAGTADVVDLTTGLNVYLGKRTIFSLGIVDPVTGPRPFSLEALALLNVAY